MKISIIVPVYNEDSTVIQLLKRLNDTKVESIEYEIIVINDGSTDSSKELLEKNKNLFTKLIHNSRNSGKGFSVREGLKVSTGNYIIFQDADLEYDPKEFKKFAKVCKDFELKPTKAIHLALDNGKPVGVRPLMRCLKNE